MFKSKIYLLTLVFFVFAIYIVWIFYTPTPRNYRDYHKLMAYSDGAKVLDSTQSLARQERKQASKQLIFNKGKNRLQWRMRSLKSEMYLEQSGNSLQLVESLYGMTCIMQENLRGLNSSKDLSSVKITDTDFDPYRFVRCIEAQDATYRYKNKQLSAEKVLLKRYKIPGAEWIQSLTSYRPFMQGNAQKIQMNFSQKPLFKAYGFEAIIEDRE